MGAVALVVGEGSRLSKKVSYSSYESFDRTNVEQECFEKTSERISFTFTSLRSFVRPFDDMRIEFRSSTAKEKEEKIRRRKRYDEDAHMRGIVHVDPRAMNEADVIRPASRNHKDAPSCSDEGVPEKE